MGAAILNGTILGDGVSGFNFSWCIDFYFFWWQHEMLAVEGHGLEQG